MALPSPPPLFAVFRRELQLFEILRPIANATGVKRLAYGAPTHVPVWTVARGLDHLSGTTHSFTIKGKQVDYTYTGAVLVAENHPQPIPIVHLSRIRCFPSDIHGVRVVYSDGFQASYFLRAANWSRVIAKPAPADEDFADITDIVEEEEEVKEEAPRYIIRPREPYQPEEMDPLKVGSCLTILFLFFLTAYLSSRKVEHAFVPDLDPYNPFENTCKVDDSTFFQDRFSAYYP